MKPLISTPDRSRNWGSRRSNIEAGTGEVIVVDERQPDPPPRLSLETGVGERTADLVRPQSDPDSAGPVLQPVAEVSGVVVGVCADGDALAVLESSKRV